ncbi:cyclase family protein [Nonomuraea gerenzanensis]|uniref:Kynurenine formamidase, bacterial n=1 Tax=Nonomuraea gerenzanensis TaxID=93944 RepID=A0A1M4ELR7_9ACTN|nr:cyclase family protein [Nonomuraea gerenzanensis]UBU11303.1 cyclase family protein [Nonomuraea gerenzanensis]SBO99779.1 Kynurenine formamidase, bacterial [Nonomuraea gerenzanensis]
MNEVVDLSHVVEHGMITYPGLPGPEIADHLSREASRGAYAPGTEFQIGRIGMVANTGTYLDTPFHRYPDGTDLSEMPLARLVGLEGVLVSVGEPRAIGREAFDKLEVRGRAVLVHTGWDRHWRTERYGHASHPFLTSDAVEWLAEQGAALVGIDSVNIDDVGDPARPAHTKLLAAGIPVVEHLTGLERLAGRSFEFHAAPPAVKGMGTFTVRAYAVLRG